MKETVWVDIIRNLLQDHSEELNGDFSVKSGYKLPYGHEIKTISDSNTTETMKFETDLSILEQNNDGSITPRVIVEAKVSISTHDAIIYSHKARSHKSVFPYLRYGIMIGDRKNKPLPGRLFRHGEYFDFMMSFRAFEPEKKELARFIDLIRAEVEASRITERMIYDSRKKDRDRYTLLHRQLIVESTT